MLTRTQQLEFCQRCSKRKFDPNRGIICSLTQDIAKFKKDCPDFEKDPNYKESITDENVGYSAKELKYKIPKEQYELLLKEQDWKKAVLVGSAAGIFGAFTWALITGLTGLIFGIVAIGIGFIVSISIRYSGKGLTPKFSILGAVISFLSCFFGNLLAILVYIANVEQIPIIDLIIDIDISLLFSAYFESVHIKELLFYAAAIIEGVKFSIRPISSKDISQMNQNEKLRRKLN
jgi:hypothetical protein